MIRFQEGIIGYNQLAPFSTKTQCPTTDVEKVEMSRVPYDVVIGSIMHAMIVYTPRHVECSECK